MAKKKKSGINAKGILRITGYSIGIGEAWLAAVTIAAICIALAVCGIGGIGIGIKLLISHRILQGLLYLGTGLVSLGIVPVCIMGEIKFVSIAIQVTKMLKEKITATTKEEEK